MSSKKLTEKQKQMFKNPFPAVIKELVFSFDVSTNKTGYAILMNGKPYLTTDNKPSFGDINMVKQDNIGKSGRKIKPKNKEYSTYGNRMFHGSYNPIFSLGHRSFKMIQALNQAIYNKLTKIENLIIVLELSEIPQFGRNNQNITSVRKLALYVGMVMQQVASVFDLAGFHFKDQALVKLVAPQEWQQRVGFIKKDRSKSKEQSLARANALIKEWGFKGEITSDDTADAINLATVAKDVRDNLTVRTTNNANRSRKTQYIRDIATLSAKISEYETKGLQAKNKIQDAILWTFTVDYNKLTPKDKAKFTKYSKMSMDSVKSKHVSHFLSRMKEDKYNEYVERKKKRKAQLFALNNKKVFNVGKN